MKSRALEGAMVALCLLSRPAAAQAPPGHGSPPAAGEEGDGPSLMLVRLLVNGQAQEGEILAGRRGDAWFLKAADLERWKIRPDAPPVTIDGEALVPLPSFITPSFDAASQQLDLTVPAERFAVQRLSGSAGRLLPTAGTFAAFLNYDLSVSYQDELASSAFLEAGLSDDWGLFANSMTVGQSSGIGNGVVRLDSYFIRDDPQDLRRLILGDTVTTSPDWGRQIRYGGVRYGTEFGLSPTLITFPTPAFLGRTAVPSNVELLVNNAVRFQSDVDQGPFSIDQVPLVTGAGEVTLVVRDATGVERRVRTPYYVSPRLLSAGLSAWSFEAGAERRDYGIASFSYGTAFAAGSYRRGLTDWLTVDARVEASGDVQMLGGGLSFVWPLLGEFSLALAGSRGREGSGGLYRASFARITPRWNIALSYQRASDRFDQIGIDRPADRIARQFQASAGASLGDLGSMVVTWTDLEYGDGNRARIGSANYSVGIGSRAYMSLFALRSDMAGREPEAVVGLGLTIPLGTRTSVYAQGDNRNRLAEIRRTAPLSGGWGYRLAGSEGENDRQQAEMNWRGSTGELSLEAARFRGKTGVRLLASGGVMFAAGGIHASRRIENGFGVVEVPGQGNVRIYQENRPVARTDRRGIAIVPDLRPYEANRISLAPSDLPLDVRLPDDTMIVVPRIRGAAHARFPVEQDRPGTVVVATADGKPVAAGANVRTDGGETLFVGFGGEIFVRNLREGMVLEIDTGGSVCKAIVTGIAPRDTLPRIGPVACAFQREPAP